MWAYMKKSGIVVDRPAILLQVVPVLTAGETIYNWAIYNGKNTSGDPIYVGEQQFGTPGLTFCEGLECSEGIYVVKGTNVTAVLVIWRACDPQDQS